MAEVLTTAIPGDAPKAQTCPHCGYCPTCGRARYSTPQYYYPVSWTPQYYSPVSWSYTNTAGTSVNVPSVFQVTNG